MLLSRVLACVFHRRFNNECITSGHLLRTEHPRAPPTFRARKGNVPPYTKLSAIHASPGIIQLSRKHEDSSLHPSQTEACLAFIRRLTGTAPYLRSRSTRLSRLNKLAPSSLSHQGDASGSACPVLQPMVGVLSSGTRPDSAPKSDAFARLTSPHLQSLDDGVWVRG